VNTNDTVRNEPPLSELAEEVRRLTKENDMLRDTLSAAMKLAEAERNGLNDTLNYRTTRLRMLVAKLEGLAAQSLPALTRVMEHLTRGYLPDDEEHRIWLRDRLADLVMFLEGQKPTT